MSGHVAQAQEATHGDRHDYVDGSPHLKYAELRGRVDACLTDLVTQRLAATGACHVLEVGAGHGEFTDVLRRAGASVTVTEMSAASAERIAARFATDDLVNVVHDPDGLWAADTAERFDVVACISVIHHIPDYEGFLRDAARLTRPGGAFVSWQDPTWYPRRSQLTHRADRGWYYVWRVQQGHLRRGLATRLRWLRGAIDETNPSDMSEYHVLRAGVDEQKLAELARERYDDVELIYYWSNQSTLGQRFGTKLGLPSTFALIAKNRRARPAPAGTSPA